jgi:SAM-dependent methyltransferase
MTLLEFIGWKATSLRNRIDDRLIERRLHIRTTGRQEVDLPDSVPYSTFAYWSIFRVLDRLELGPADVFVDVGCGKGRVVCTAALRPMRQVFGVDIDEGLCRQARANASGLRGRLTPIEIVNVPAQHFDYRDCTALFFFNPFGFATFKTVVDTVIDSLRANPRPLRLVYVHPRHESVLADAAAFERYDHWPLRPMSRLKFDISFWRSIGDQATRS